MGRGFMSRSEIPLPVGDYLWTARIPPDTRMASKPKQKSRAQGSKQRQFQPTVQRSGLPKQVSTMPQKQKALKVGAWERMVANPDENQPVRTPSINPYTGAVRNFKRTFSYAPDPDPNAPLDFVFRLSPSVRDTFGIGNFESAEYPATQYALSVPLGFSNGDSGYAGQLTSQLLSFVDGQSAVHVPPGTSIPGDDPDLCTVRLIDTNPAGTNFEVASNFDIPVLVYIWVAGVRLDKGVVKPRSTLLFSQIGDVEQWAFRYVADLSPKDTPRMSVIATSGTWRASQRYDLFNSEAQTLASQRVSTYRVTAMSMLVSCAASSLENGGVIAAARTRPGWVPSSHETAYESITRLQDHSYKGPVRDGAYVWWLPTDLAEMDQRPFGARAAEETALIVAGRLDSRNATLQITFNVNFEFYSALQLFEHEVGPPLTDDFVRAYHFLDSLPAATCNPKHSDILKGVLKSLGSTAKKTGRYLAANPELLMALLG